MDRRDIRDFTSVLDELLAEDRELDSGEAAPRMRLDPLSVAEELHSGRIVISPEDAAAAYRADVGDDPEERIEVEAPPIAPEPVSLDTDPKAIARELGIEKLRTLDDLDALRRRFASTNHPDRVAEHLRADAMIRMQIANGLIDDAKRRRKEADGARVGA